MVVANIAHFQSVGTIAIFYIQYAVSVQIKMDLNILPLKRVKFTWLSKSDTILK